MRCRPTPAARATPTTATPDWFWRRRTTCGGAGFRALTNGTRWRSPLPSPWWRRAWRGSGGGWSIRIWELPRSAVIAEVLRGLMSSRHPHTPQAGFSDSLLYSAIRPDTVHELVDRGKRRGGPLTHS